MPKLTILVGLPASGKSTEARRMVEASGNTVRLNRDDLRAMLFDGKWTAHREDLVRAIEIDLAYRALLDGYNVIVDDTNLSTSAQNMWRAFANEDDNPVSSFQVISMATPLDECIARDTQRDGKRVGRVVIENMALRAGLVPIPLDKQIVLVDMDGTLSDSSWRAEKYLHNHEKKDWEGFFSHCQQDPPNVGVVRWVQALIHDYEIYIVSGRPENYGDSTMNWLKRYGVSYKRIFMRRSGDKRDDDIVKKEILDLLPKDRIAFALDDRPRIVRMWRENGIKVYPIGPQDHDW